MTTEQTELKPCPFCGGQPSINHIEPHSHPISGMPDYPGSYTVECGCGAGLIDNTQEAVVARWNTRHTANAVTVDEIMGAAQELSDAALCEYRGVPSNVTAQEAEQRLRAMLAQAISAQTINLNEQSYVANVPSHCDRIIWRGDYYHLPVSSKSTSVQPANAEQPAGFPAAQDSFMQLWMNYCEKKQQVEDLEAQIAALKSEQPVAAIPEGVDLNDIEKVAIFKYEAGSNRPTKVGSISQTELEGLRKIKQAAIKARMLRPLDTNCLLELDAAIKAQEGE